MRPNNRFLLSSPPLFRLKHFVQARAKGSLRPRHSSPDSQLLLDLVTRLLGCFTRTVGGGGGALFDCISGFLRL